ncbi:MAG: hypothetical protein LBH19_02365 [Dysgonamonadaceae bacterium]|jgi:hypothetical protein|nr:hypothetical protein [Dysgonamonadaceae bacterium]
MTKAIFLRNVAIAACLAAIMMFAVSCNSGGSKQNAAQSGGEVKTETAKPKGGTSLKEVNDNNWQAVLQANYGVDLKLPEGWSFKEVSTLNGVSNVKLFLTIGGGETGESFGRKLFETTKTLSPHGNYKSRVNPDANTIEADNAISDFNSANAGSTTDIIAKWNYTFNGRMVQLNYYANGNTAEYTFNLN